MRRRRGGTRTVLVVVQVAVRGRAHEGVAVVLARGAFRPVLAIALHALAPAVGEEIVAPGRRLRPPEAAPGHRAFVVDVGRIRVVVATRIVLGIARFALAEQADPVVAEASVAHTEVVRVEAAIPARTQADGLAELALVGDLEGRGAEAGDLDAHAPRIGQGDHQRADERMELQLVRNQPLDGGIGLFQGGAVRHQRSVARGQRQHLVVDPDPDDLALLAQDADPGVPTALLVAQHLEFLQPQSLHGRGIVRLQAQVVVVFGDPPADAATAAADIARAFLLLDRRQPGLLAAAGLHQADRAAAFRWIEIAVAASRQPQHRRQQYGSRHALHGIAPALAPCNRTRGPPRHADIRAQKKAPRCGAFGHRRRAQ